MAGKRHKGFRNVGEAVKPLMRKLNLAREVQELAAQKAWADLVGGSVARRSAATKLAGGVLYVTVENSAWLNELNFIRADYLAKLQEILGKNKVKDLQFRVGVIPEAATLPDGERPAPFVPSPAARARAEVVATSEVRDADLAEAVKGALAAVMTREETKGNR